AKVKQARRAPEWDRPHVCRYRQEAARAEERRELTRGDQERDDVNAGEGALEDETREPVVRRFETGHRATSSRASPKHAAAISCGAPPSSSGRMSIASTRPPSYRRAYRAWSARASAPPRAWR